MELVVLAVLGAVLIALYRLVGTVKERGKDIQCPRCALRFRKDIVFFMGLSLTSCPFCQRVISINEIGINKLGRKGLLSE